jgi:GTPase
VTTTGPPLEKAFLAGLVLAGRSEEEAEHSLNELAQLASTAGAEVAGRVLQRKASPDPGTFLGSGKTGEVKKTMDSLGCGLLIVDDELKPTQQRNLEKITGQKVLDRAQIILDVFAQRARTNEGKLQVELAQLTYLLPRLTGQSTELSRLGGGIGTRGPGETKLESDRRRIRDRIVLLKREIDQVTRLRALHRDSRKSNQAVLVALAGYTNAGKSSLFNALTGSDVLVQNRLFSTLDPCIRPLKAPQAFSQGFAAPVLLADTVGFIHKLPHTLVAAFRATLEEVAQADLRLQVADASSVHLKEHLETVDAVLGEILESGGGRKGEDWLVLNKADLLDAGARRALRQEYPQALLVSAKTGEGLESLKKDLAAFFEKKGQRMSLVLPASEVGILKKHYDRIRILSQKWDQDRLKVEVLVTRDGMAGELAGFEKKTRKGKIRGKRKGS